MEEYGQETFLDRVYRKSKSESSRAIARASLDRFEKYCSDRFNCSSEDVISDINQKKVDVYRTIDDFIGYLDKRKDSASTIITYVAWVKKYLVYRDIDINPYRFKEKVSMPKKLIVRDAELNMQQASRILQILPMKVRILCILEMTTLRRPHELVRLRVRDFDFTTRPTTIIIPANLSKNRVEGVTFTTTECSELLTDYIRSNRLGTDDYLFGDIAKHTHAGQILTSYFRRHMKKLPDLQQKINGSVRYKVHPYSFKKLGYTLVDKKWGKNFADGLKGAKGSEYYRLPLEEKKVMYLELEPELTVGNADQLRKELNLKYAEIQEELRRTREDNARIQRLLDDLNAIRHMDPVQFYEIIREHKDYRELPKETVDKFIRSLYEKEA